MKVQSSGEARAGREVGYSPAVDTRIKALFFTVALGGGGAESHVLRLLQHLDRSRCRPLLAVARGGGAYEAELPPDVRPHVLGLPLRSSTASVLSSLPRLVRVIEEERVDVLVPVLDAPVLVAAVGAGLARALRGSRTALVPSVQAPPRLVYTGASARVVLPLLARAYHAADAVLALSEGVARELREARPSPSEVHVVYNACVDDALAARAAEPLDEPAPSGPWLVAAGRLTAQKDYPTLLRAIARVRARRPVSLVVLGEGPDRAALEALAAELGIADAVRFLGFRRAPQRYMARATAFVLASRFEGFGNVVAEALSVGAPVIATDCPHGPREILEDGRFGLLVPPEDPDALAAAIGRMLEDEPLRASFSRGAKARGAAFGCAVSAECTLHVLESVMAARGARPYSV